MTTTNLMGNVIDPDNATDMEKFISLHGSYKIPMYLEATPEGINILHVGHNAYIFGVVGNFMYMQDRRHKDKPVAMQAEKFVGVMFDSGGRSHIKPLATSNSRVALPLPPALEDSRDKLDNPDEFLLKCDYCDALCPDLFALVSSLNDKPSEEELKLIPKVCGSCAKGITRKKLPLCKNYDELNEMKASIKQITDGK